MICIDTNILIYAHRRGAMEHEAAKAAIERAASNPRGWGFSLPSVGEFWAQVTHPRNPGGPSSPEQAGSYLKSLVQTGAARIFIPGTDFPLRLLDATMRLKVTGPRIFDIQIGLLALSAGAKRLWTHDRAFIALPGLTVEDPLRL